MREMDAKTFVDSLFEGYEKTAAIADFKEELLGNLNAKIESFVKKGMDADAAFAKASAELGDVSALADELSQKKRKEVFEEVYMEIRNYMTPKRVAAYVIFSVLTLFGIAVAFIVLFSFEGMKKWENLYINLISFFSVLLPFLTTAVIGFTFLGLTQETPSMNPLSAKRTAWYASAAGLIAFGLFVMPVIYFGVRFGWTIAGYGAGELHDRFFKQWNDSGMRELNAALFQPVSVIAAVVGPVTAFVLPGTGLLAFLILTEKDRRKPWAKSFTEKTIQQEMAMWTDPATASRFGMFSGAIWILAAGLFVLLGFLISFKYSWLVFILAVGIQLLMMGGMYKKMSNEQ
jgi:MFS family permease